MSGGGAKGGPQMSGQQSMGGGKGGPQRNPGPGGNQYNNPYPPGGGFPPQFNPANNTAKNLGQSLGSAMNFLPPSFGGGPQAGYGMGMKPSLGSGGWPGGKPAFGGGLDTSGLTPISDHLTPPTPQPQEPVGGYIGGQPAQFHYQAEALKKPVVNNAGLPAGGILAKLFGG